MTQRNWYWEAKQLLPHLTDLLAGGVTVQAGGGGLVAHALDSTTWHVGTLAESQAPWAVTEAEFAAHTGNANAHHAQLHSLADPTHHSGQLPWAWLNKVGSDLAHLETRSHDSLQDVTADQHHAKLHNVVDTNHHSIGGSTWDVVGNNAGALGLLSPTWDVRAGGSALLRSNVGLLALKNLLVGSVLQSDSDNGVLGVNVAPAGAALDIRAGSVAHHSQRIRQIAGQTGRLWRIESTSGQELIVLDSAGNLQSGNPGFVSGLTGWQVTPVGNVEFNNGRFRGELHASVFVFDEVNVRNGTDLITPAGGALELDATLSTTGAPALRNVRTTAFADQDFLDYRTDSGTGSGTGVTARTIENLLAIKNPDTGHYKLFRPGEALRSKVWTGSGISDIWMRVNSALDMGTYWAYFVEIVSGTLPVTLTAGAAVAGYGLPGDGAIRLSADDPYGPLIDIFTRGAAPWNGADLYPHVRLGRLDGVGLPGVSGITQWGMVAGANLADANSPYLVMSNLQQKMFKIASEWSDGVNTTARIEPNGRARFGVNVDSPANTFLDIDPGLGLATFRGAIEILAGSVPVGNISGLGALATVNNLDGVPDGSTYKRVTSNEKTGAGRGYSSLDASGALVTKVVPGSNVGTPGGAGLYLGADKMGYFNGSVWKTFMNNLGHFAFGGESGARLAWDGTDLFGTDGTNVQWYARASTGKLYAGAGAVTLDKDGMNFATVSTLPTSPSLRWMWTTAQIASMYLRSWYDSGEGVGRDDFVLENTAAAADTSSLTVRNYNQWNAESILLLEAKGENGTTAGVRAYTNSNNSELKLTGDRIKTDGSFLMSARSTSSYM